MSLSCQSWYGCHIAPYVVHAGCSSRAFSRMRQPMVSLAEGVVVEVGFGSGLNVPYYPAAVTTVHAIEPADLGWQLASKRLAESTTKVERTGLDGQSIPLPDDSCDTALST